MTTSNNKNEVKPITTHKVNKNMKICMMHQTAFRDEYSHLTEMVQDSLRFGFNNKQRLTEDTNIPCYTCNQTIQLYWEPRYHGLRGRCKCCGTNWAES